MLLKKLTTPQRKLLTFLLIPIKSVDPVSRGRNSLLLVWLILFLFLIRSTVWLLQKKLFQMLILLYGACDVVRDILVVSYWFSLAWIIWDIFIFFKRVFWFDVSFIFERRMHSWVIIFMHNFERTVLLLPLSTTDILSGESILSVNNFRSCLL